MGSDRCNQNASDVGWDGTGKIDNDGNSAEVQLVATRPIGLQNDRLFGSFQSKQPVVL